MQTGEPKFKRDDILKRNSPNGRTVRVVAVNAWAKTYHIHDPADGDFPSCGYEVLSSTFVDQRYSLVSTWLSVLKPRREIVL